MKLLPQSESLRGLHIVVEAYWRCRVNRRELLALVGRGEDSQRQFKVNLTNADSLAADLVAFSNSKGGTILIGVADDGTMPGLTQADVRRLNQLIGNAATQHMRSPVSPTTENVSIGGGRVVIVLTVPEGLDKPYFDRHGVIWVKTGSDRRRIQSKEELRRLFQMTDQFHADELPTKAGTEALDKLRFRDFLREVHRLEYPDSAAELARLLRNLNLATETGVLNLAGLLLFAEQPERFKPQFILKAIRYPGVNIHSAEYLDTEDYAGPLRQIFDGAMGFIQRNLHKRQAGRGVNAPGVPEIPTVVFEELLVNALVHRDYLISAPIRLFVFDDRIEIVSPGHLPNHLTVDQIRAGNSNIRNPILVSHVAKGLLPYRGLGSGIKRALEEWPRIDFIDDKEGCLFTAVIGRGDRTHFREVPQPQMSGLESRLDLGLESETSRKVLAALVTKPLSRSQIARALGHETVSGAVNRAIKELLAKNLVEYTIPEKPQTRLQEYRLTETSRRLLKNVGRGENG